MIESSYDLCPACGRSFSYFCRPIGQVACPRCNEELIWTVVPAAGRARAHIELKRLSDVIP